MSTYLLTIEIESFWHSGSGKGDGPSADALVSRDISGLPFLPGKTLKGIMRDAFSFAESLGHVPAQSTHRIFGGLSANKSDGMQRFFSNEGLFNLSDAMLAPYDQIQDLRQWADHKPEEVATLSYNFSSTAIDENKRVKLGSLRMIEFIRPITLYAHISEIEDADAHLIQQVLPLIRNFGLRRSRGFGACKITMEKSV